MKTYEALELGRSLIRKLMENGVNPQDVKYLDLYRDFHRLKNEGHKLTWVRSFLSDEYGVTERHIHRIVNKFDMDIDL